MRTGLHKKKTNKKNHRERLCRYADSEPQALPKAMPDCLMHEFGTACRDELEMS